MRMTSDMPDIHARCRDEGECKGPQVRSCLTISKETQEASRSRKDKRRTDNNMGKNRERDHIVCGKDIGKELGITGGLQATSQQRSVLIYTGFE